MYGNRVGVSLRSPRRRACAVYIINGRSVWNPKPHCRGDVLLSAARDWGTLRIFSRRCKRIVSLSWNDWNSFQDCTNFTYIALHWKSQNKRERFLQKNKHGASTGSLRLFYEWYRRRMETQEFVRKRARHRFSRNNVTRRTEYHTKNYKKKTLRNLTWTWIVKKYRRVNNNNF